MMTMVIERAVGSHPGPNAPLSPDERINNALNADSEEVAARALWCLWHELDLGDDPSIFWDARRASHRHHHAYFLNTLLDGTGHTHLARWQRLVPPPYAHSVADIPLAGPLLTDDLSREASPTDRETSPGPASGWYRYDFPDNWSAISVMLAPDEEGEATALTIIPQGRQDDWLAFLEALQGLHDELLHRKRRGQIAMMGFGNVFANKIREVTFEEVILPEAILASIAAQRRIFSPEMLARYASLGVPRLRKILLVGPPGTGKTTILKAEAARHARLGGYVIYVSAAKKAQHSWETLSQAMSGAAASRLPTLIVAEDFEQFVSDAEDFQRVLNTLDGVATPDNPAGTLILATTNDPQSIDPRIRDRPGRIDLMIEINLIDREDLVVRFLQRFLGTAYSEQEHASLAPALLKQTGSHIREVCLLAAIRSLEE